MTLLPSPQSWMLYLLRQRQHPEPEAALLPGERGRGRAKPSLLFFPNFPNSSHCAPWSGEDGSWVFTPRGLREEAGG